MKKLGIVIVNYNDYKTTIKLLENIKDYKILDLIVIVDNNSSDSSIKELKKYASKKVILLENKENKGYASGLNTGAKYINKKLKDCNIIFSNSDIIIKEEADLEKLSNTITEDIKVVGPNIIQNTEANKGWILPTIKDEILFNLPLISRKFKKKILYRDSYYKQDISIVDVVSGCFFMVDGKTLEEVDYFDENTFLYYEENILAKKIKMISKKEAINNKVSVIHDHSITIDKNIKKINKYKILKESQKYYVEKYLKANKFQLLLLYLTNKLSLLILYIRCYINKK